MTQEVEMKVDINEVSPVLRELRFEIPWQTVQGHLNRRYAEIRKKARPIRGFRKGKAPRWLLEQMFGPQVQVEVTQALVTDALTKAIIEHKIAPVATPQLEPGAMNEGKPYEFTATIEVRPKVENLTYEGLEVERPIEEVTDKDVDAELEKLREDAAALQTPSPERPAKKGDVLVIDYSVQLEGSDEPERTREDQEVEIGKGLLIEQVEDSLIDMNVGDEKDVPVEFPQMPGQDGEEGEKRKFVFHVKVKEIKEKLLPEVDDDFAKDVSEHETLLELRLGLREQLEKKAASMAESVVKDKLLDALCDANPIEIPPSLVEQQLQDTQAEVAQMLQMDVSQHPFSDEQTERMREQGERKVRAALLLTEIAEDAKLEVGDEDIEERLKEIAEQLGQPLPKVKAQYGQEEHLEQMKLGMLQQRVVEHILSKANITDVPSDKVKENEGKGEEPAQDSAENAEDGGENAEE